MDCGIGIEEFWELSLREVRDKIESYNRKDSYNRKKELSDIQLFASLTSQYISTLFSKDVDVKTVFDIFPELFKEDIKQNNEKQRKIALELNKEKARLYAKRFNEMRRERG